MQSYLKATVSQITRTVEAKGMLEPEFLSEALIGVLPNLETAPNGMPEAADFAPRATEALLAMIFPGGKKDLPIPDIAKDFVWRKANQGVQDFFLEITDPNRRILWATDRLIPMTTSNEALIGRRLQDVEDMRNHLKAGNVPDTAFIKKAEAAFKRYTVSAAVRQADHRVKESNLWGPFKWIARQVVKAVTYLAVRFSLRDRIYAFVADPASDQKIRQALWAFLHFKAPAQKRSEKERQQALNRQLQATLAKQSIAPTALQGIISSQMADYLANKNVLDVLT